MFDKIEFLHSVHPNRDMEKNPWAKLISQRTKWDNLQKHEQKNNNETQRI